jgi:hypothetical protein
MFIFSSFSLAVVGIVIFYITGPVFTIFTIYYIFVSTPNRKMCKFAINLFIIGSVAHPGPGSGAFLTPGFGIGDGEKIRIRDEHPRSFFSELRNSFSAKNT